MRIEEVTFDNFLELNKKDQEKILKDPDLLKELVKKNISARRFKHSLSTAEECRKLALFHEVDPKKAYMAGLLHDCCKFEGDDADKKVMAILALHEPKRLKSNATGVFHSWAAYYYLKEKLNYQDEEVLTAIYNHTILNSDDKLSMILWIVDKREPLRGFDDNILEVAQYDLYRAYSSISEEVEQYIKSKHERYIKDRL